MDESVITGTMDNFRQRLQGYDPVGIDKALAMVERVVRLERLGRAIRTCRACQFRSQATQPVPGQGNPMSPIVFVGEGPGEHEDLFGAPFVGIAGVLLTHILDRLGYPRETIYLTNAMRCLTADRKPTAVELQPCKVHLEEELAILQPRVIVALGNIALHALVAPDLRISKARGRVFDYRGTPVVPTWHPAYILRKRGNELIEAKQQMWADLQLAISLLPAVKDSNQVVA